MGDQDVVGPAGAVAKIRSAVLDHRRNGGLHLGFSYHQIGVCLTVSRRLKLQAKGRRYRLVDVKTLHAHDIIGCGDIQNHQFSGAKIVYRKQIAGIVGEFKTVIIGHKLSGIGGLDPVKGDPVKAAQTGHRHRVPAVAGLFAKIHILNDDFIIGITAPGKGAQILTFIGHPDLMIGVVAAVH